MEKNPRDSSVTRLRAQCWDRSMGTWVSQVSENLPSSSCPSGRGASLPARTRCLGQPSQRAMPWGQWGRTSIRGGAPESSRPPLQSLYQHIRTSAASCTEVLDRVKSFRLMSRPSGVLQDLRVAASIPTIIWTRPELRVVENISRYHQWNKLWLLLLSFWLQLKLILLFTSKVVRFLMFINEVFLLF